MSSPPWKKVRKAKQTPRMLAKWREIATGAALQKGARRACGLCKRAMMGLGSVEVRPPWPTKTVRKRWLCVECWKGVTDWLELQEYERDGYDLPIDRTASGLTRGSGKRGTYIKR